MVDCSPEDGVDVPSPSEDERQSCGCAGEVVQRSASDLASSVRRVRSPMYLLGRE